MARSQDKQYESLARSTNRSDWQRVNPKDKSKRYQYTLNSSITISYRHYREWPGTRSGWQTNEFDTLGELLRFVAQFGRSVNHVGYINAFGKFKEGYILTRPNDTPIELEGWRNISPTTIFSVMLRSNFYIDATNIAASIFQSVEKWGLTWRKR